MHCSTNLQISPIIPRLPHACAFLAIVCLLVRTSHPIAIPQRLWLPAITMPSGCWSRRPGVARCKQKAHRYCIMPVIRWAPLLARLLARCALLGVLLHTSGWLRVTPLSWSVLLLPVAQILALRFMPRVVTRALERRRSPIGGSAGEPKRVRRWANSLQRPD